MDTNIKNLPEGNYFTEIGYSQQYPWVEVSRTAKTVTVVKVAVKADPAWKPEMVPGGFCAHCTNQWAQTWLFDEVIEGYTKVLRMTKYGWACKGVKFVEGKAVEFYDYNF
jgi:hypothetical protein